MFVDRSVPAASRAMPSEPSDDPAPKDFATDCCNVLRWRFRNVLLVLGLARSGQAAALALRRRGTDVIGVDASEDVDVGRLAEAGVELHLGTEEERLLDAVETVIKSPGVPGEASLVAAARERGIPVWSEVELGSRLLPNPIVAVTGTNGKTTTSELLGAMLGAPVVGNVGRALTDLDGQVEPHQLVVCEVSSFQLEDVHQFRPQGSRPAQPRARPPRPARLARGLPRRQAPDLREPG